MKALAILMWLLFSTVDTREQTSNDTSTPLTDDSCPPWQVRNRTTGICKCVFGDIQGIVKCRDEPYSLQLFQCFCMTYYTETNQSLVGSCQYTCARHRDGYFFDITVDSSLRLNESMCSRYKRQGQLCGSCIAGFSPPVYSYSLSCVNCTTSNWAKYTAVSLLPVTAFFFIAITFRLSATSPKLSGYILCLQMLLIPSNMRLLGSNVHLTRNGLAFYGSKILTSVYGIWNLDFLRLIYTPFCLQPQTNTLQVLALDYVIAVYPLLLIVLSYLLVLLYDHNVRLIVYLWKPFVPLFIRLRREWNIRNSLVDAFATFFLLSYVKILSVSMDLLMPVPLYDPQGHIQPQLYLFNQGDVAFLGSQHLSYACLALFFLFTFTLLPMLLLFLYPCSCFQICLNRTRCSCQLLHTFMDTFQGHYKNGTSGTRDLRFFSGLYLLLRVVVYASTVLSYQFGSYMYTTVIIAVFSVSVALARPYKEYIHNVIDSGFLIVTALLYVTVVSFTFGGSDRTGNSSALVNILFLITPFIYVIILLVFRSRLICLHLFSRNHYISRGYDSLYSY